MDSTNVRRSTKIILAFVFVFVPFVPAKDPCPDDAKCLVGNTWGSWGSPSYVMVGVGAIGAYPIYNLHNESGHHIPVVNYFETYYGVVSCSNGALWETL